MSKKESNVHVQQEQAVKALRMNQRRLLDHEGVTSVGVGYCMKDGKPTEEICIVCTVEDKLAPEAMQERGITPLPSAVAGPDGTAIRIDVIERSFRANFQVREESPEQIEAHDIRRTLQEPMMPGISVSNVNGTAGTIGAFVFDRDTGEPLLLSNWHVLHGPDRSLGESIVQPGPFDDPSIDGNECGVLLRSHLGMAGDCAVARLGNRSWKRDVLEIDRVPRRMADPDLGDRVIKSGRTTGVTRGIVSRIDVVAKINYGGSTGLQEVGGFEVRPNPDHPLTNGELSMGGDSGSLWMLDVPDGSPDSDIVLGLHFAGETDPTPSAEHAVACKITSVADKLKIVLEPSADETIDEHELLAEVLNRLSRLEQIAWEAGSRHECQCQTPADFVDAEASLPIYGNWCGPGHGSGRAIDDVDGACKQHDECYDRRGYLDCDCDRNLLSNLDRLIGSRRINGRARSAAIGIRAYFSVAPCVRHARIGNRVIPIPSLPIPNLPNIRVPNVGGSVGSAVNRVRRRLGF
jgi:hypothetical protein